MATALQTHNTHVMLRKVVTDKVQEINDGIVRELEEIITYGRGEEKAGVNLESVMQEENDCFYLLNNTQTARKTVIKV